VRLVLATLAGTPLNRTSISEIRELNSVPLIITIVDGGPLKGDLPGLETAHPSCTSTPAPAGSSNPQFLAEVLCDSQVELNGQPSPCPNGQYPRKTTTIMHPLPTKQLKSMPNPCAGVPKNPWCKA